MGSVDGFLVGLGVGAPGLNVGDRVGLGVGAPGLNVGDRVGLGVGAPGLNVGDRVGKLRVGLGLADGSTVGGNDIMFGEKVLEGKLVGRRVGSSLVTILTWNLPEQADVDGQP